VFAATLAMGIECRFGTGKTEDGLVDCSGNRGYSLRRATAWTESMLVSGRQGQRPAIGHTCRTACRERAARARVAV
jgi:hypothetical protein